MSWGAVAGAAIGVGGSLLLGDKSSDAAGQASDAQVRAAQLGIDEMRRQYDLTRDDNAIMRDSRDAAQTRLNQLLGIGTGVKKLTAEDEAALREELRTKFLPKFSTGGTQPGGATGSIPTFEQWQLQAEHDPESGGNARDAYNNFVINQLAAGSAGASPIVDEAGLNRRIDRRMDRYEDRLDRQNERIESDPSYGSLLDEFTMKDLRSDPVYKSGLQFGLEEGRNAIDARAVAGGGYDSGATLKALTRYANDYGSTKANESYNRFHADKDRIYNKLAGVSGAGQQAVNQVTTAGTNTAANVSQLYSDMGNSRAASIVGGANAWNNALGGINNAWQGYQNNRTLQTLLNGRRGGGGGSGSWWSTYDPDNYNMGNN